VLFGFAEAFGFRLQGNGLPAQITDAAPYVVTLIALLIARRHFSRTAATASTG
jgi:simple sugar transport system permease protein